MFGITFTGHPDLTRILMPEDWEGHPLRKDYGVGRVPGAVQGRPGAEMSDDDDRSTDLDASRARPLRRRARREASQRADGRGELGPRSRRTARSSRAASCACPRTRRSTPSTSRRRASASDETMIINLGPQHPSTHGVLRIMLELDGETVLRSKPVIGYLHTGMEKTGEELTYVQGATNVTRMDYLSPLANELVFSLAVEELLGIEIPPRATWIRMLMASSTASTRHVTWAATNGMDLASTTMMIFGFREREMILSFFEKTTGLRMNHELHPPRRRRRRPPRRLGGRRRGDRRHDRAAHSTSTTSCSPASRSSASAPRASGSSAPSWRSRSAATGPILRAAGVPWDLRRSMPYLAYDEVDFDVIVGTVGDTFDRYAVRLNEIRESIRIVAPDRSSRCRAGDYRVAGQEGDPAAARAHRRVDGGADPPLQDLHRGHRAARGRGLRRRRVAARRARLLPRLRRREQALPDAHPRPELRQPAEPAGAAPRRARSPTRSRSSPRSTRCMGEVDR